MKKISGLGICLFVILGVFTIGYFVVANKISYDFATDFETELYNLKISSIEDIAFIYATNTENVFGENKDVYITVDTLAQGGLLINNDGVVEDPRDSEKKLNDLKIKLTNDQDKITAKVLI